MTSSSLDLIICSETHLLKFTNLLKDTTLMAESENGTKKPLDEGERRE